ncbi:AMP-binding enzyme [Brevibacterium otitidis]|uniref:AMP-binding enzyme C-terminal domain-containing protein n=1 Tax=Brevibacterium otitidis TaxID=53364 RepID=A0ABV5X4L7_9MICO|nr:hypothetical protein GCM10023233_06560 [Brevibacterium otitidis]
MRDSTSILDTLDLCLRQARRQSPLGINHLGTEELRDHLSGSLARYKIPREVVVAEALPRNPSGKLLKHVLRSQVSDAPGPKKQLTDTSD